MRFFREYRHNLRNWNAKWTSRGVLQVSTKNESLTMRFLRWQSEVYRRSVPRKPLSIIRYTLLFRHVKIWFNMIFGLFLTNLLFSGMSKCAPWRHWPHSTWRMTISNTTNKTIKGFRRITSLSTTYIIIILYYYTLAPSIKWAWLFQICRVAY